MPTWSIVLIVVGAVLISLFIAFFAMYNNLVKLSVTADEGFSTMDVYLKQRYDLIPNLVNTVKGYLKHEKETLENIVKLRASAISATTNDEKVKINNELTQAVGKLIAVAEAYPDLKANANFIELQHSLEKIEQDIVNGRKYYNASIRDYNKACRTFPSVIVAKIFKFEPREMFVIEDQKQREPVIVEF